MAHANLHPNPLSGYSEDSPQDECDGCGFPLVGARHEQLGCFYCAECWEALADDQGEDA